MSKRSILNSKRGFTLAEILLVIAIIGILVAIVMEAGSAAKAGARDNQRKTDISLLQLKIEAYRAQYGVYPTSLDGGADSLTNPGTIGDPSIVVSSAMPKDPSTGNDYEYDALSFTDGTNNCNNGAASYYLSAAFENNSNVTPPVIKSMYECNDTSGNYFSASADPKAYSVTSPN